MSGIVLTLGLIVGTAAVACIVITLLLIALDVIKV